MAARLSASVSSSQRYKTGPSPIFRKMRSTFAPMPVTAAFSLSVEDNLRKTFRDAVRPGKQAVAQRSKDLNDKGVPRRKPALQNLTTIVDAYPDLFAPSLAPQVGFL